MVREHSVFKESWILENAEWREKGSRHESEEKNGYEMLRKFRLDSEGNRF